MRDHYITTSEQRFQTDSLPFRLYQKAKRLGVWDPKSIDFSQDIIDWQELSEEQRMSTLRLLSSFQAGEEAVTLDILPLIMTIAREGRIEEEMFLTTFLFEEAKHTEFFQLVLQAIGHSSGDLSKFHSPTYRKIFYEILPEAMERLLHDQSPEAVAEASTVYNMFIEGVLAETGYFSFYNGLHKMGKMPGLMKGIEYLKKDESRHIGYGTFLLQRLICEHPHLYDLVEQKLTELAPLAYMLNSEGFEGTDKNAMLLTLDETIQFSMKQLQLRLDVLARAKTRTVEDIYKISESEIGVI
jgi:ribonucleoside-diphosphate reductase beta chain